MESAYSTSVEESAHASLYKYSSRTCEQSFQERVKCFLQNIKEKRHKEFDKGRCFQEVFFGDTSDVLINKNKLNFKLMKSERIVEIPEDISENWLMKFCPDGFRILVIAEHKITKCYSKRGKLLFHFKSNFPGGGNANYKGLTVLDCIYNKTSKTIFVCDCLCWNSMSLLNSEASFRFFWIQSKFNENSHLTNASKKIVFYLLHCFTPDLSVIKEHMLELLNVNGHFTPYDGIVLYHKEGFYTTGISPLVGWLPSFILPEIFLINVNPAHLGKKPENFINVQQYFIDLSKKKSKENNSNMDFEEIVN